ncbi:MAG: hypothetical protein CFH43_00606 [Proteobacteria bacterium]|nr:MAG: hypothetical protein CFH43_00606 [Pseudomonadota bacterium]|tara:strand:- start:1170 stop:2015 length:846 start_codon:yes stop_codon:yes gene_type:complete
MMKILSLIFTVLFCAFSAQSFAYDWKKDGERLTFSVSWSFVHVGNAELLLRNDADEYEIIGRAWTDDTYNSLYRLRDRIRIEGVHTKEQPFLSKSYVAELKENDYRADKLVTYNHEKNICTYTNRHKNRPTVRFDVEPYTRDMISALYALRSLNDKPKVGDVYTLPVVHYDSQYTYTLRVLEKERMDTALGKKDVFEIQPILTRSIKDGGKSKARLRLWVTADGQFVPVKVEIKLNFGSFRAMLTNAEGANSPSITPIGIPEEGEVDMNLEKRFDDDRYNR